MTDVQTEDVIDPEAIVAEARDDFELSETLIEGLKGRKMRTRKMDLGFDEVNGERLEAVEGALAQLRVLLGNAERNGKAIEPLQKELAKLKRDIKKANAEEAGSLQDQIDRIERGIAERKAIVADLKPLREKLNAMDADAEEMRLEVKKASLSVELRALPYTIARGAARRARKHLGITEKGIPEDKAEEFNERQLVELAYDQVVRFRDNRTGATGTKLTVEQIEAIRDYMPMSQSGKFFTAVEELQFSNAISESAIAQADF